MTKGFVTALALLGFGLVGCSKNCSTTVMETTELTNLTGHDLSIQLCKVPYQKQSGRTDDKTQTRSANLDYKIASDQNGTFKVDSYDTALSKDSNNKCETNAQAAFTSQVFLNAKSFDQVKLCRDDVDPGKVTIVVLGAGCPTGSTAQAYAITNCNESVIISSAK